jgi:hypothetical protein
MGQVTPLSDALTAAQRRALAALEKAYVAGAIESDKLREGLHACGVSDDVDISYLTHALDLLREWGAPVPAEPNGGEPKKATEGQVKFIVDLLKKGNHGPLAEQDLRALTFDRASALIDALKAASYDPAEWDVPF